MIKEALNNALKYSKATEVCLSATIVDNQIEISVQDNGIGFDLAAILASTKRNGLGNMRQRIETLGGQLLIETNSGKGAMVKLSLRYQPLDIHQSKPPEPPKIGLN